MVNTPERLAEVCATLATRRVIGVDTESDSMHHYQEKVCLVQISDLEADYIIDPLAVPDLSPLGPVLADPQIIKVFHGADYDVVCLRRDFDFTIRGLFDTMISAQFLGAAKVGLADLVGETFGVPMDKKYQVHDWASRPLLPEHLDYARGDTHFLIALRELLMRRLEQKGRLQMVEEECRILEDRQWRGRVADGEAWTRTKGANTLDEPALRVLRTLYQLRDTRAREMDRPPYKVFPDAIILRLAQVRPRDIDALGAILKPRSPLMRRHGEDMLKAILAAEADTSPLPEVVSRRASKKSAPSSRYGARETERLFNALKQWRDRVQKRDRVPLVLVASNNQLKSLAGWRPHSPEELREVEDLRTWQIRLYGEELLALVADFEATLDDSGPSTSGGASGRRRRKRRRGGRG